MKSSQREVDDIELEESMIRMKRQYEPLAKAAAGPTAVNARARGTNDCSYSQFGRALIVLKRTLNVKLRR